MFQFCFCFFKVFIAYEISCSDSFLSSVFVFGFAVGEMSYGYWIAGLSCPTSVLLAVKCLDLVPVHRVGATKDRDSDFSYGSDSDSEKGE